MINSIKILIISFCIIVILSHNVLAIEDIFSTAKDWMDNGKQEAGIGMNTENLRTASNSLYNVLLAIATIIAIIVGAILGIKYMTASLDTKAQVKESLFPYLISCIVVFGSLGIWKLVVTIMKQI